ncbi:MAG: AraC family transcriptional regulator [Clostridium sp.]
MDIRNMAKSLVSSISTIPVTIVTASAEEISEHLRPLLPDVFHMTLPFSEKLLSSLSSYSLYHMTGYNHLNFIFFCLRETHDLFIIGPYLTDLPHQDSCAEILQSYGLTASLSLALYQYYLALPISEHAKVISIGRTCCQLLNDYDGTISYEPLQQTIVSHLQNTPAADNYDSMAKLVARRYELERLMLSEVQSGNAEKATAYFSELYSTIKVLIRSDDPIRNRKNLAFAFNTMLRKSLDETGIHPIYIDILSNNFAYLIESCDSILKVEELFYQMITFYCSFVQKYRPEGSSPLIRKTVNYIRIHLGDDLTLPVIAAKFHVSPSYLSKLFNEDRQISLPNYISKIRVEKACDLLKITAMPIQDIAYYVGFSDLNYFSRCFKKHTHKTATEYRNLYGM